MSPNSWLLAMLLSSHHTSTQQWQKNYWGNKMQMRILMNNGIFVENEILLYFNLHHFGLSFWCSVLSTLWNDDLNWCMFYKVYGLRVSSWTREKQQKFQHLLLQLQLLQKATYCKKSSSHQIVVVVVASEQIMLTQQS